MKKIMPAAIIITACAALYVTMWPSSDGSKRVTEEITEVKTAQLAITPEPRVIQTAAQTPEKEEAPAAAETAVSETATPAPMAEVAKPTQAAPAPVPTPQTAPFSTSDPYHTDIYPQNVYSEELIYDADGNLIGKTTTYPTVFGEDTVWIDGRAYGYVPGFGLVEWSGPSSVTEDYIMCENGNKVGVMGGEDEATAQSVQPSEDIPEPTGEVIDQTINSVPERNSTPPDYKPVTTPPSD